MSLLTWLVEQFASCFIGEGFNSWKDRSDNRNRLKIAEKTIGSILENEKKNASYYDDLDRTLTNSRLIEDFVLKIETFDLDRLTKRIEQRINADEKIPCENKKQVAEAIICKALSS